jgi:hypothetical protein
MSAEHERLHPVREPRAAGSPIKLILLVQALNHLNKHGMVTDGSDEAESYDPQDLSYDS